MVNRISTLFLCLAFVATFVFFSGCGHNKYDDEKTGITIRELGSDLDNRWAFRGVVVESVKPGSPADKVMNVGELISYIVDERKVTNYKEYKKAFAEALDEDERAKLRILKVIPATTLAELGLSVKPDPEERGVIVASVDPGSKAMEAGIKRETIIYEINGKSIRSIDDYNNIIAEALVSSKKVTFGVIRDISASKFSKVGIAEIKEQSNGIVVIEMKDTSVEGSPARMEGIKEGDVITHIIDEMKIINIDSYKEAVKKAFDADKVTFKRGELGGIKLVAIEALGQIGDVKAVAPLLKALESKDRWIRRSAAAALEKMNDERMIQPLMWHLLEENELDAEVRRSSARALARMQPAEAIELLAKALKDSSLGVRLEAGNALGRIGESAIDTLIKARYDEDSRVRDSAVAALGSIGGKLVRNELISVLRDKNEESTVKLTAIQALDKIGDSESVAELRRIAQTGEPGLRPFVRELLVEEAL